MNDKLNNWDKINAVKRMQDYILAHFQEEITLQSWQKLTIIYPGTLIESFRNWLASPPLSIFAGLG